MFLKKITLKEKKRESAFLYRFALVGDIKENSVLRVTTCNQTFPSAE